MATQRRFRQALRVALLSLGTATPATWAMVKTTKQPFEHQIKGGATVLLHKGRGGFKVEVKGKKHALGAKEVEPFLQDLVKSAHNAGFLDRKDIDRNDILSSLLPKKNEVELVNLPTFGEDGEGGDEALETKGAQAGEVASPTAMGPALRAKEVTSGVGFKPSFKESHRGFLASEILAVPSRKGLGDPKFVLERPNVAVYQQGQELVLVVFNRTGEGDDLALEPLAIVHQDVSPKAKQPWTFVAAHRSKSPGYTGEGDVRLVPELNYALRLTETKAAPLDNLFFVAKDRPLDLSLDQRKELERIRRGFDGFKTVREGAMSSNSERNNRLYREIEEYRRILPIVTGYLMLFDGWPMDKVVPYLQNKYEDVREKINGISENAMRKRWLPGLKESGLVYLYEISPNIKGSAPSENGKKNLHIAVTGKNEKTDKTVILQRPLSNKEATPPSGVASPGNKQDISESGKDKLKIETIGTVTTIGDLLDEKPTKNEGAQSNPSKMKVDVVNQLSSLDLSETSDSLLDESKVTQETLHKNTTSSRFDVVSKNGQMIDNSFSDSFDKKLKNLDQRKDTVKPVVPSKQEQATTSNKKKEQNLDQVVSTKVERGTDENSLRPVSTDVENKPSSTKETLPEIRNTPNDKINAGGSEHAANTNSDRRAENGIVKHEGANQANGDSQPSTKRSTVEPSFEPDRTIQETAVTNTPTKNANTPTKNAVADLDIKPLASNGEVGIATRGDKVHLLRLFTLDDLNDEDKRLAFGLEIVDKNFPLGGMTANTLKLIREFRRIVKLDPRFAEVYQNARNEAVPQ